MAFTYGAQKRLRLLHKARAAAEAYGASDLRKKKKEKMVQVGKSHFLFVPWAPLARGLNPPPNCNVIAMLTRHFNPFRAMNYEVRVRSVRKSAPLKQLRRQR